MKQNNILVCKIKQIYQYDTFAFENTKQTRHKKNETLSRVYFGYMNIL